MKLLVTVKPRSRQQKIEKTTTGYTAYVREEPVENRANRALIELLAEYFGVTKSQVTISSGRKSKQKIVEIKNLSCL
ncbi:MAG: DUF167 domain-containing protein [Nitrospirota bacterium]|jgi:uncharacterized protein YggU (UPF0235/DUF167 family)